MSDKPNGPRDPDWVKRQAEKTEASFKVVVQVRDDRVWVGTFYGNSKETSTPGRYETFPRPEGKTHADCVKRALERAAGWVPEDFSATKVVSSDW